MGNKISAVNGVKSDHFYEQGNAINEIWLGDVELISRLPFGDSDLGQAGWPPGNWPKIPWHQFIIPLKRELAQNSTTTMPNDNTCTCVRQFPQTGYFGMYKSWPGPVAEFFGTVLAGLGFFLCLALIMTADQRQQYLRTLLRPAVRLSGENRLPAALRKWHWTWFMSTVVFFTIGFIFIVLALPAMTIGLIHNSASEYILGISVGLMTYIVIASLSKAIQLTWDLRRVIAKYENSVTVEEGTATAGTTVETAPATVDPKVTA
ncbi:uncharacterized protein N7459_002625 [Penicillium hispanicum]|uniref:uncharacterized protein n=1 Tax=Penicillium hispanicum TaxID=1080232 RepID=UPI002541A58F|nr:uncharacterized protein N7459_002625 [Penicillium hispanicum]KAJ5586860.1 hypothetical protein N7459_002625 [Penicillium hispanicum]